MRGAEVSQGPGRRVGVFLLFLVFFAFAGLAGCAWRRIAPAGPPAAARAAGGSGSPETEGPPRPPDLSELLQIGELPAGEAIAGGLPGGNPRVNQDTSGRAQNETTIAANPTDPLNLVGAWNDYFVVNPGQNTVIGYGWTTDGGQTWQSSRINFSSLPSSQSTGDPAVTVDSQGNFYLGILAYSGSADGILVAKSTDGGATWQEPVRVDNGGDKEFLTVDPANDNIYIVWSNFQSFVQTIFFSKSTDGGASFTPRRAISTAASSGNGPYPAVGPNGEIYVVWSDFDTTLFFDRSFDQGETWLDPDLTVTRTIDAPRSPLNGGFRNPLIPAIAVDRTNGPFRGRIYVVWADERFTGDPDIALAYSDDHGNTWSPPVRVNDDAPGNDADQFFPWVAVDANGHVHVTFLDRREDPDGLLFAMYLATSTDGGVSFGPNVRVSDGIYGPSNFGFLGDYTGADVSGDNRIHPMWPDGRLGDEDIFAARVNLADYDEDAVLNDGDGSGGYADNRCTGGASAGCDDNCPGEPNPDQLDSDGDGVGDACDNCPASFNTDQFDTDRDGIGDACDGCPGIPGGDASDEDGDGLAACVDNCPATANPGQEDLDGDGLGDVCDPCPQTPLNDADTDGVCGDVDNCPDVFNPFQRDDDGDGVGELCDTCPGLFDPGQEDLDGDGAGDGCDCQAEDGGDRRPGEVRNLTLARDSAGAATLSWSGVAGADAYSVSRGRLGELGPGAYGSCLAEGVAGTSLEDAELPPAGEGFFYLVQAQSFDCGLGPLGHLGDETERMNGDPAACNGLPHTDVRAQAETPVSGTVSGDVGDTAASDDTAEAITEVESQGGPPRDRFSLLEHRWSVEVVPGSRIELHVEGFRTSSPDGDDFVFEYSTDGGVTWNPIGLGSLPFGDDDRDRQAPLPASLSGTVWIRVVDTRRAPGGRALDTVSVDELFVRSVP